MPLPLTSQAIEGGIAAGLHTGAQVALFHKGQLVADDAFGAVSPDTLLIWLSSGKPITAVAIAILWERDLLDLDDPVARFIPEFAARGKQGVTLRHLLTHTAGFRGAASAWTSGAWDEIIARICAASLEPRWVPGQRAGYHVASSWFVLGEIVARITDKDAAVFIRQEIFLPLGMADSWLTMPPEIHRAYGQRIGITFDTSKDPPQSQGWEGEEIAAQLRPAANIRGPAHDLARFCQAMLNKGELDGRRILCKQTVEALTTRHRVGMMDETFRQVMDWGLGFILNSEYHAPGQIPYGFGPHASLRTFGHGGSQSSVGFADPESQLAGAVIFNGMPGDARHDARLREVMGAIYSDLNLA
jgi:CubicO group peptidase (beta-lactamase class C family)